MPGQLPESFGASPGAFQISGLCMFCLRFLALARSDTCMCLQVSSNGRTALSMVGRALLAFISACELLVWSNHPIPVLGWDDWNLLVIYRSGATIRSRRQGWMIGICL